MFALCVDSNRLNESKYYGPAASACLFSPVHACFRSPYNRSPLVTCAYTNTPSLPPLVQGGFAFLLTMTLQPLLACFHLVLVFVRTIDPSGDGIE